MLVDLIGSNILFFVNPFPIRGSDIEAPGNLERGTHQELKEVIPVDQRSQEVRGRMLFKICGGNSQLYEVEG